MRISWTPWVVLSFAFILLMVIVESLLRCNGMGCSWAKDTDTCGLSRHRATCKSYRRSSTLAMEKRREWAKELIRAVTPHKLTQRLTPLAPIQFTNDQHPKPIAHYEPSKGFKSHVPKPIDPDSITCPGASAFTISQDPDVEIEDITQVEEDNGIPASRTRSFELSLAMHICTKKFRRYSTY
ncbi:hypothetical protein DFH29DRAFT_877488 [Suillus ampliporus]|nr:hypothetical protein DFH29DRAFT_877488 [Suillus ampliporus]